jgi:Domain of unknown function (DUF6538)
MLYRLVRPMKRPGSSIPQYVQRIPTDVRPRVIGRTLVVLLGNESVIIRITPTMGAVRFSLRTRDPVEAKIRQGKAVAHLKTVWRGLRNSEPVFLTNQDAPHALPLRGVTSDRQRCA